MIRKALLSDVPEIRSFLEDRRQHGIMPRPLSYLYEHLRDYFVAALWEETPNLKAGIVGVGALHLCWEGVGEIRSVAVHPDYTERGLGTALIHACLVEAVMLRLQRVFVLTLIPDYFKRFGFQVVAREDLPLIAWADCINCVKFPDCDEVPMLLIF